MYINNNDTTFTMWNIHGLLEIVYTHISGMTKGTKKNKTERLEMAYMLQQACEKLIKIQIYRSGLHINNQSVYTHDITNLISYARTIGVNLIVPQSIEQNAQVITKWEAKGRYDMHLVVRVNDLHKWYRVMTSWYKDLYKVGYRN